MFGLVLAIGIVVDDAIVVVENMERNIREGLAPFEAAKKSMTEVGGAIIATSLVLVAVFLPTTFLEGISGQFYRQFGVTIAVATVISSLVSLTLTPAMAAIFMRPQKEETASKPSGSFFRHPVRSFFYFFNRAIDSGTDRYTRFVHWSLGAAVLLVVFFVGLLALTVFQFARVPGGFIPTQDQGYFIVGVSLPAGSSLARTNDVMDQVQDALLDMDGVATAVSFAGFSGATFSNASNAGAVFPVLESFEKRRENGLTYDGILAEMRKRMNGIRDAYVVVIPPPPVRGVGRGGGFKMMVQDTAGAGLEALNQSAWALIGAASQEDGLENVFTFFDNKTPQLYVDIDRAKAERLGIPLQNVFNSLEVYLGSAFVNNFNFLGRTFQVIAQADFPYRVDKEDILDIRVKDTEGQMTPIGSFAVPKFITGPSLLTRYNLYPAIPISGDTAAGFSSGQSLTRMESLARNVLPDTVGYEWTEIAFQQKLAGNTGAIAFTLAVLFVFLLLAAQYESWSLPLAVILIVPLCLLSAITGISIAGMENNILTQIGFVVLIGLACKNAILIVEFAKQKEDEGMSIYDAAVESAKLRLRPILMTAFSFILGVVPLVIATGAGSEMRQNLGVTVFSGMLGVTVFGLFFTPLFYVLCRLLGQKTARLLGSGD